jgi:hypothetical protein
MRLNVFWQPTSEMFLVYLSDHTTVAAFKELMLDYLPVKRASKVRAWTGGKIMVNSKTIFEYGLRNDSEIILDLAA